MPENRALVLTNGKDLFESARARLADRVEFRDVVAGVDVPCFAPEALTLATIDSIMAHTPFQHVVATSESHVAFAGLLRSRYGLEGMGYEEALVATNKWRMKQAVAPLYPTAAGWLSGSFLELPGARPDPVVVKPLSGSSATGVRRMALDAALRLLATCDELLLVEEWLDVSEELHCDGLVRDGQLAWVLVSVYDQPVLVSSGRTRSSLHLAASDPRVERATDAARQVLAALGSRDCVFHLELLDVEDTLYFGEIGLRPGGGGNAESIARSYGSDLWLEFVAIQIGISERLSALPRRREDVCGVIGVVPPGDGPAPTAEEALRHPCVTGAVAGNLPAGCRPENSCTFSHLLFVEGLPDTDVRPLLREIGLAHAEPA